MSKDEMDDLQEIRNEDPRLEQVLSQIRAEYNKMQQREWIRKPLAAALYKIWKEVDRDETEHR